MHARTDTLGAHLELLRCYYNFVRPHRALRFGRETRTPAMQAGLATRRLTLRDIFVSVHQPDEHAYHRHDAEVAPPRTAHERVAHHTIEIDAP